MRRLLSLAILTGLGVFGLGIPGTVAQATPSAPSQSWPRSILWVAAHPDDELLAVPLLAELCLPRTATCTLLVLTRGEAGHCLLPRGCRPDLGVVRSREMARSARQLHAHLILWDLPDSGGPSGQWAEVSGGEEPLTARLASAIAAARPDLVLTFDPRHGTTCHGDHRETGRLVVAAMELLPRPVPLELLETVVSGSVSPFAPHFAPAAPPPAAGIVKWNFSRPVDGRSLWSYVPLTAAAHRSQFSPEAVEVLRKVPAKERAVYTAPASVALASDSIPDCE